jgi:hypothetical protein
MNKKYDIFVFSSKKELRFRIKIVKRFEAKRKKIQKKYLKSF